MDAPEALRSDVLRYIRRGVLAPAADDLFDHLAVRVFRRQFAENEPYRRYCERRGASPGVVDHWSTIPAVPTAAYKSAALVCGDPETVDVVFRTSGTTQGTDRRGAHYVRDLSLYRAAALPNFKTHLLPDTTSLRMLILAPDTRLASDSSLAWMLDLLRKEFGTPDSVNAVDAGGLRLEPALSTLAESEAAQKPIMLLGTAAAYLHLLEALEGRERRFELPAGSRLMETGGFKRRRREIPKRQFYSWLEQRLGIPGTYCVAEYGMTELCSQFYDNVLREQSRARPPLRRYKTIVPWVRTQVVDAETLEPLPAGRTGLLRHVDLANLDSVLAVQTEDLGIAGEDGFEILGRAAGAELRGCSIAMDEWLTAQR